DGAGDADGAGPVSVRGATHGSLPSEAAVTRGGTGAAGAGREQLRRLSLVDHTARFGDTDGDDEDDDEEDSGWGQQVVIKPVKVALWDKRGVQLPKERLSLNKLRARIIARAESTPQKATYRRAAKLGVFVTVLLPVFFTLCTMVAYAWIDAEDESTSAAAAATCDAAGATASSDTDGEDIPHQRSECSTQDAFGSGGGGE
ncbi:unnamed protein product, partial [Scytosiphon promiscuus]